MKISHLFAVLALSAGISSVFAAEQASAPAKTLPSGVVVKTLRAGTGAAPAATDTVEVHYRGTFTDGKEFDSSYKRGTTIKFPLNRVIPCWTQGVQEIHVGGKAHLTCPGSTAYGPNGVPGTIPPNATLEFDVELVSISKAGAAPAAN